MPIYEGELYGLRVQVTNNSFKQGVSAGADLTIAVDARTPTAVAIDDYRWTAIFGPGEQQGFSVTLNIPPGTSGQVLAVKAGIYAPDNRLIAQGSKEYLIETLEPEKPPFDPWSYDFNGDGYIDRLERLVAEQDHSNGIITQEQLNQVLAVPEPPPLEGYTLYVIPVTLSPGSVTVQPEKSEYEEGEMVTLTAHQGDPEDKLEWVINEEGQWPDGEVYWQSEESAFFVPGWYTRRRTSDNPIILNMRANTWISCIFGELDLPEF